MNLEDIEKTKEKQQNIKLFPIYKAISWDLLFFYTILFLFLTQVKGISAADVLLAEATYPVFKCLLLMPLTMLIEKIGKRKSLIFANLINALSVAFFMMSSNLMYVIIAQFFSAIAFDIKGIAETNLLYDSLPKNEKRGHEFSKIDGRGLSLYYYFDAISSAISGFLYVVNPYVPLALSLIISMMSAWISYKFVETEENTNKKISTRKYVKDLKTSFRYMFQSSRLKYLLLFGAIFSGLLGVLISLRSGVLEEIGVPEQYFGIIFASLGLISGFVAKKQQKIHEHFRNRTLSALAFPTAVSCILVGLTIALKLPFTMTLVTIIIMFAIQFAVKGPFYTLIKRYLNNFTTTSLRSKISSCYNLMESIMRATISLFASLLLRSIDSSGTMCIIGCILTIVLALMMDKMNKKVGLKPEEYKKSEIEFLEIK